MIKDRLKMEKEALKEELKDFKDYIEEKKRGYREAYEEEKRLREEERIAIRRALEDFRDSVSNQIESIEEETNAYNDLIDAQIESLHQQQLAEEYARRRGAQEEELADLESEIAILSLDNSADAIAERLRLEDEANQLRQEMGYDAADEQVRLQEEALEAERQAAEESSQIRIAAFEEEREIAEQGYELRLRELEDEQRNADLIYERTIQGLEDEYAARERALQDKIDQIDAYLQQEGNINNEAMRRIADESEKTYQELIEWNKVYGTGISDEIISMWELATAALNEYRGVLSKIEPVSTATIPEDNYYYGDDYSSRHHSGVNSGFVGKVSTLKSNEEFAKLLKGELVVNPRQMDTFMTKTLPQITNNNIGGNTFDISMPLQIFGSVDKSVLPSIEEIVNKAVKKLNDNMMSRGFSRRADSFST